MATHIPKEAAMTRIAQSMAFAVALGAGIVATAPAAQAQERTNDPRVADLVKAGEVRVAFGLGTPMSALKNPTTGELRGLAVEMGRALAQRLGVKLVTVVYPRPGAVIDGLRDNAWDVSFLVFDPDRVGQLDYSHPYVQSDFTYLVPAGSRLHSAADADQPGVRIATPRGDGADLYLTRTLKRAVLMRTDSHQEALELVRNGLADAKASARSVLMPDLPGFPGARVLDDGFADITFSAVVPKGQAARLAYLNEFVEEAKASGLVKRAIESVGIQGVRVTPSERLGALQR
jgi:polar amino acid transport system substrate-binding protein